MKRLLVASALVGLSVFANACGTEVDDTDRALNPTGNVNYTLYVYDGQTGAPLDNATVSIQTTGEGLTSTRVGDAYVINNIPSGTFPVTITADGYLPLTGVVAFAGNSIVQFTAPTYLVQYATMYSVQSVTADLTIRVYDNDANALINNGQILARITSIAQTAGAPTPTTVYTAFPGTFQFLPSVITANISSGQAVIPRDQLVFGATYSITVIGAQNSTGQYLSLPAAVAWTAGTTPATGATSNNPLILFAGPPAVTPVAISSNTESVSAVPTQRGELQVTFPYAVEVCSLQQSWTLTFAGYTGVDTPTQGVPAATATPSANAGIANSRLTVVPNIVNGTDTASPLRVTVNGISVKVSGTNDSNCTALNLVSLRNTAERINTTITIR